MSHFTDIRTALLARLATITVANGYATDAGLHVHLNLEYQLAPPEKPALILYPGEITDSTSGDEPPSIGYENRALSILVEGFIADTEAGNSSEALRGDIIKALKADPYFGNLTEGFGNFTSMTEQLENGEEGLLGFVEVRTTVNYSTPWGTM